MLTLSQKRILLVDDNEAIHQDFRKLLETFICDTSFDKTKSMIFANSELMDDESPPPYIIDSAYQGEEALDRVKKAKSENRPYALAFVDIRMPPGWDGVKTIQKIWEVDTDIQIVICTAYSDYSWKEIIHQLKIFDNLLILKKPFDAIEVCQMAAALTKKWELKHLVQQQIDNLERIVQERTADLHLANRIKSDFLSNMSLELRTPLNSIVGFSQLLYEENMHRADHHKEYCHNILVCSNHLTQMISDMFDISEIESGKLEFHPQLTDLTKLVQEIENIYHTRITEKHIQFSATIDPTLTNIIIDPIKLKQVLFHYLSNAIKFTQDGGKIKVSCSDLGDGKLRLEVTDTGIGIREEDVDKLFIAFNQLDSSTSKRYPGAGIGLILTRRIAELQGGEVGVKSTFGQGSTFFAILPYTLPKEDDNV